MFPFSWFHHQSRFQANFAAQGAGTGSDRKKGFPAHPILTVADHDFTRYPLTLVTTHLLDDRGMLPDTCHAAKAAECAQGDNCTALLTLLLLTLAPMQPSRTVEVVGRLTGPWQSTDLCAGSSWPNGQHHGHWSVSFSVDKC